MTFAQVIEKLQMLFPASIVGETCRPGNSYYDNAFSINYRICSCSLNDASYGAIDYIGRGKNDGIWYIGYSLSSGMITCGPKGFHYLNNTPACI